jgi:hypothetical protein
VAALQRLDDASGGAPIGGGQELLNEFAYRPRLFHLERVHGEFVDNELTVEGRIAGSP